MENLVISEKLMNAYFVKYPFGSHINFFATSHKALIDGLIYNKKYPYKPEVYNIETYHKNPKFRKLTGQNLKNIFLNIYK